MQHFKSEFSIRFYFQFVYLEKVFLQVKGVSRKIDQYGQTKNFIVKPNLKGATPMR